MTYPTHNVHDCSKGKFSCTITVTWDETAGTRVDEGERIKRKLFHNKTYRSSLE